MKADLQTEGDPAESLAGDLGGVMVPALGWASEVAVRFGHTAGSVLTLAATLGCTALTLGSVAVVARRCRTAPAGFRAAVVGALLSSGPIALVGAVLGRETHHRALGGVTFAFIAAALVGTGFLVARRALGGPLRGSRGSSVSRWVLSLLVITSTGIVVLPLLREFHAEGSATGRFVAEDLAVGVSLAALLVLLQGFAPRARAAPAFALAWVLSVAVGAVVLAANMPLRAMLASHAPVALGPLGLGLGIAAAGPLPEIPSPVDVSLH